MAILGVNIDHVATVREARKTNEPDPVWAATLAELRYAPEELAPVSAPAISRRSGYDRSNLSAALQSMGEEFTTSEAPVILVKLWGTANFAKVRIIRDNQ